MNGYFYVLTAIDLFVLSFMCILTKLSESLNKKQKQGFFFAFALIAVISVLEVVTLAVDGTPAGYRWLNILSNYLGFGLSPGVCLCLVYVMDRKKRMNRWFRAAVCCEACYLLFLALSIPAGLVFSVSADNVYSRGQYFYIYIIMYFAAIVYLSVSTFVTAREFQNRSRSLIYPLMIFLLIETIIQVTLPELHVTWLCVTLLSVLYFIYCSEMWNQLDALTGLLNQNSYLNRTAEMRRRGGVLVVFDVDDFKQINDRFGHQAGDAALYRAAQAIKSQIRSDDELVRYGAMNSSCCSATCRSRSWRRNCSPSAPRLTRSSSRSILNCTSARASAATAKPRRVFRTTSASCASLICSRATTACKT